MHSKDQIIHGDCAVVLSAIPGEVFDLAITSPPYDDLRDYGGHLFNYQKVIASLYRSMKPNGVVVWVVGDSVKDQGETGNAFRQALFFMECGFKLHDTMIFEKNTSSFPAKRLGKRYTQIFDFMFVFSKDGPPKTAALICDKKNKWQGWTNWGTQTKRKKDGKLVKVPDMKAVPSHSPRNNIWKYTVSGYFGHKDKEAYKHPATFPEKLVLDHIKTWSKEGDLVVDPMCGSGTVCKVAKEQGRRFLGIEIDEKYCELARRRIQ